MQHIIDVFLLVFDRLFCSEFLRLFVFALQFLEFQSHIIDVGIIRAFGD